MCPGRRAWHKNNLSLILYVSRYDMRKDVLKRYDLRDFFSSTGHEGQHWIVSGLWSSWWDFCQNQLACKYYLKCSKVGVELCFKSSALNEIQNHSPQPQNSEKRFSFLHANRDIFHKWLRANKLHPVQLWTIMQRYMNCVCLVFTRAV